MTIASGLLLGKMLQEGKTEKPGSWARMGGPISGSKLIFNSCCWRAKASLGRPLHALMNASISEAALTGVGEISATSPGRVSVVISSAKVLYEPVNNG